MLESNVIRGGGAIGRGADVQPTRLATDTTRMASTPCLIEEPPGVPASSASLTQSAVFMPWD